MLVSYCALCGKKKSPFCKIENSKILTINLKILKSLTIFLTGNKFMPGLHLKQPRFRETGILKHLYRNELGKTWFTRDAVASNIKYLARRTISDKILKDRGYEIAKTLNKNLKYLLCVADVFTKYAID